MKLSNVYKFASQFPSVISKLKYKFLEYGMMLSFMVYSSAVQ